MKNIFYALSLIFFELLIQTKSIYAQSQSSTLKLPTTDNTSSFDVIGSDDSKLFRIFGDGGFYISGSTENRTIPIEGAGARLMWYPGKAAVRVGKATSTEWNDSYIGLGSAAIGVEVSATNLYSMALGNETIASGVTSTAIGGGTTASGNFSTSMGFNTNASGSYSTTMGFYSKSSGNISTAIGDSANASGRVATAIGNSTIASGDYSTALGNWVNTYGKSGSFIIGDNSSNNTYLNSSTDNEMTMRFAGGYRLFTSPYANVGVQLTAGGNTWAITSDSTKKYAFLPVNGESVLHKISKFNLRTWSYKSQDSAKFRHYGPMAQEFFNAFGHDKYGIIGNDTTINTSDFEGLNLIAIQALEKRTEELSNKTKEFVLLKEKVNEQQKQIALQQKQIKDLEDIKAEFSSLKNSLSEFISNSRVAYH